MSDLGRGRQELLRALADELELDANSVMDLAYWTQLNCSTKAPPRLIVYLMFNGPDSVRLDVGWRHIIAADLSDPGGIERLRRGISQMCSEVLLMPKDKQSKHVRHG